MKFSKNAIHLTIYKEKDKELAPLYDDFATCIPEVGDKVHFEMDGAHYRVNSVEFVNRDENRVNYYRIWVYLIDNKAITWHKKFEAIRKQFDELEEMV